MQAFEEKKYDVTDNWEAGCGMIFTFGTIGWTTRHLTLEADEAVLKTDNFCCHTVQKRPYAQLGSVDSAQECGVCWSVKSDISGDTGAIKPACGCEQALVEEIIAELQARKIGRGNVAQLKAHENLARRVDHMDAKLDAIMKHLGVDIPPAAALTIPVCNPTMER